MEYDSVCVPSYTSNDHAIIKPNARLSNMTTFLYWFEGLLLIQLVLTSVVILDSESRKTPDQVFLSHDSGAEHNFF